MAGLIVILALALVASVAMRPGQAAGQGNLTLPQVEYRSFWLGLAFFALVFSVFRLPHASGLVVGLVLHELGHFLAYSACGHRDVRFRLLPMAARGPASEQALRSAGHEAFVTLMGAGLSIGPMVLLIGAAQFATAGSPLHAQLMGMGGTIAALNALNLLPLWPMDGARCLALISRAFSARMAAPLLLACSAFATALAVHVQSTTLAFTCLIGAHIFYHPDSFAPRQAAMPRRLALLVTATWAAIFATHLAGGWWMLKWFLFSGL